jgi:hypothetical protein
MFISTWPNRGRGFAQASIAPTGQRNFIMARDSYMPDKQADQVLWSQTFVNVVGAAAAAYGVSATLMTAFETINTTLQTAWTAAIEPSTRTKGVVAAKNDALKAMKAAAKNLVSIIQGTPTVTDQMKIDAGVKVRDTHRSPVPAPANAPIVKVKSTNGRTVTIELLQTASKRSKPAKVTGATVFTHTGPTAPIEKSQWEFFISTSKTTIEIPFGASETGDTVWITAFWHNSKDQSGPAAAPICVDLPRSAAAPMKAKLKVAA